MLEILMANDAEKISEYTSDIQKGKKSGFLFTEVYNDILTIRRLLFLNSMVCVGEIDKEGNLDKLFSCITPSNESTAATVCCICPDEKFIEEAIKMIMGVYSHEEITKFKLIVTSTIQADILTILKKSGFNLELSIKEPLNLDTYSFFT
ncbi:MAG: hypothetical protein AB7V07_03380 [Candidatus Delongbacteria bacterium]|jgi:hypothetical protein